MIVKRHKRYSTNLKELTGRSLLFAAPHPPPEHFSPPQRKTTMIWLDYKELTGYWFMPEYIGHRLAASWERHISITEEFMEYMLITKEITGCT